MTPLKKTLALATVAVLGIAPLVLANCKDDTGDYETGSTWCDAGQEKVCQEDGSWKENGVTCDPEKYTDEGGDEGDEGGDEGDEAAPSTGEAPPVPVAPGGAPAVPDMANMPHPCDAWKQSLAGLKAAGADVSGLEGEIEAARPKYDSMMALSKEMQEMGAKGQAPSPEQAQKMQAVSQEWSAAAMTIGQKIAAAAAKASGS